MPARSSPSTGTTPSETPTTATGRSLTTWSGGGATLQYLLDLRTPAPPAVRSWLHAPAKIRVTGATYDPSNHAAHHMTGGSLAEWFDLVS